MLVGFRIPTQAAASIDLIEVVDFLPPYAGDMIVVPSEHVAKGGSDFDVDKLNVYFPHYKMVNGKPEYIKGDGHLYTSKLFPAKPTSLVEAYVQNKPDGEIYYVITAGSISGLMGPHGSQIQPDDRWKIINYLRSIAK